ncbi:uncharacterized protein si:dkey-86e18.1 isoform X2 [Notolabrus celidotus]|uniref:uncharacterized protein si:dkey-86e18.1 isoform X2 n=1 Tax=Notolabrus celidotus TaxID=1203425 RepID=UPI0014903B27|nr:uncharacterized protein si:dkey-86e18.1 isoform X2 [Notolabrus celidotus]
MARNEEKQQGRLNRLWLQREREAGRLRDVQEKRPRLAALTSASSVKKWIPSIKSEIEYYLQSQLTHYPERKIAQFQLHIQALEREYKNFISKLRVLDPTCKHTPWTPRAYCKRRADPQDGPCRVKSPRLCETNEEEPDCRTGSNRASDPGQTLTFQTEPVLGTSGGVCADQDQDQDQPLSFDRTRLAVAVAAYRGPVSQLGSSQTQSLTRVLQSGLPNLMTSSPSSSSQSRDSQSDEGSTLGSVMEQRTQVLAAERNSGKSSVSQTAEERSAHVLGLDCYSSSSDDEEEAEDS